MKKIITILAILLSFSCSAQHWAKDTNTVKSAVVTSDQYFQKASLNLTIGLSMLLAGGGIAAYSGSPDVAEAKEIWLYTGTAIAVGGIVMQFIGFNQIGKAGRCMEAERNKGFSFQSSRYGIGIAYRF